MREESATGRLLHTREAPSGHTGGPALMQKYAVNCVLSVRLTLRYFLMSFGHEMGVGGEEAGPHTAESAALKLHCFTRRTHRPCPPPVSTRARIHTQKENVVHIKKRLCSLC